MEDWGAVRDRLETMFEEHQDGISIMLRYPGPMRALRADIRAALGAVATCRITSALLASDAGALDLPDA